MYRTYDHILQASMLVMNEFVKVLLHPSPSKQAFCGRSLLFSVETEVRKMNQPQARHSSAAEPADSRASEEFDRKASAPAGPRRGI